MDLEAADLFNDGWAPSLSRARHPARLRLAELTAEGDDFDLSEAALLVAAEERDLSVVGEGMDGLEALADELRPHTLAATTPLARLEALIEHLFVDEGFLGNEDNYYDPRNSYLDHVLERRLGIPITLGVVVQEVGARVGVPLQGVGFPAHFLLRHARLPGVYVDPFHHGRLLSISDCKALLERATRGRVPFRRDLLKPISNRRIIIRMLNNLRAIHSGQGDVVRTLAALDRILMLAPASASALKARGALLIEAGAVTRGLDDLETYLALARGATDWLEVKRQMDQARRKLRQIN